MCFLKKKKKTLVEYSIRSHPLTCGELGREEWTTSELHLGDGADGGDGRPEDNPFLLFKALLFLLSLYEKSIESFQHPSVLASLV